MSALRDEIRAILREEIAALRSEAGQGAPATEQVRITSGADLTMGAIVGCAGLASTMAAIEPESRRIQEIWSADDVSYTGTRATPT